MGLLDTVNVSAFWDSVAEPVVWIAEHTDALLQGLSANLGVRQWELLLPSRVAEDPDAPPGGWLPWEGDKAELVARCPLSASFDTAELDEGYSVSVHGRTADNDYVRVRVNAGSVTLGRRVPEHSVSVEVAAPEGDKVSETVAEPMVRAVAESFNPRAVSRIDRAANKIARRSGWHIRPSSLLWLRDDVLDAPVLPKGITAERVGSGWLYVAPRSWSAEELVAAHEELRSLNGIDVVPH